MVFGGGRRGLDANQAQFVPVEQFPLDLIARVEADGGGQGQGKTHVEPGLLSLRANGLDFQRIGGWWHFF